MHSKMTFWDISFNAFWQYSERLVVENNKLAEYHKLYKTPQDIVFNKYFQVYETFTFGSKMLEMVVNFIKFGSRESCDLATLIYIYIYIRPRQA